MKIKMTLLSDVIPGNGNSIPGREDIAILADDFGFPYYKGGTFKGIFREELINLLLWEQKANKTDDLINSRVSRLLGTGGDDTDNADKLRFFDFCLPENVKKCIIQENIPPSDVLDCFSYLRTFTSIEDGSTVENGSLRTARCLKKNLIFYGQIICCKEDEELVKKVLSLTKWIGTMRNRGFGKVKLEAI